MSHDAPTLRVAGVQMDVELGDLAKNRARILEGLNQAADANAQLIVFPECALCGYGFESREEAFAHAEPLPGPSTLTLAEACARRGVWAIVGMLEQEGDRLYNTCVLIGPTGLVGRYRKIHLPFMGVDRFTDPGTDPFALHEVEGVRVGMHICYDGSFPESGRVLTLLGADLLVLPTNWPVKTECAALHMVPCRAFENVVYMIAVNRVGQERGTTFIGRSSVADPDGRVMATAGWDSEELILADIDAAKARRKRLVRIAGKHEVDRIGDRRPAFYGELNRPATSP